MCAGAYSQSSLEVNLPAFEHAHVSEQAASLGMLGEKTPSLIGVLPVVIITMSEWMYFDTHRASYSACSASISDIIILAKHCTIIYANFVLTVLHIQLALPASHMYHHDW
jgi:hypothetical protein